MARHSEPGSHLNGLQLSLHVAIDLAGTRGSIMFHRLRKEQQWQEKPCVEMMEPLPIQPNLGSIQTTDPRVK